LKTSWPKSLNSYVHSRSVSREVQPSSVISSAFTCELTADDSE
jgi:hypothetical protein